MKRIGLLVPSSSTVQETDFYRRLPADATLHVARMKLTEASAEDEASMLDHEVLPAAERLASTKPDIVVFSCTSAGALRGDQYDADLCEQVSELVRAPAISTIGAVRKALELRNARRVAVVTPYTDSLSVSIRSTLTETGFRVTQAVNMGLVDNNTIGEVSPIEVDSFVRANMNKDGKPDALFISCCNLRSFDVREDIETYLGLPVVTSNHAAFTAVMRELDLEQV